MSGGEAKRSRPVLEDPTVPLTLTYRGQSFQEHSPTHQMLYERAIRAKVAADPAIADALVHTGDRVLTHIIRGQERDPVLCAIYTRLRFELQAEPRRG
jgi:hypothetical protein